MPINNKKGVDLLPLFGKKMYYYKLTVAYDGTDYCGWQWQPHKKTVAGQLEKSFYAAFKQKPISLTGASRTDTGVHAWGQVVRVRTAFYIEPLKLQQAWQGTLPSNIMLRHVQYRDGDFGLHDGIISKTYDYYLSTRCIAPFFTRYCASYYPIFDAQLLEANLQIFLGTHDFRSFCTGDDKENTVRTIHSITICHLKRYNLYRIRVQGPGFLRYMVRRIVGGSLQAMTMQLTHKIENGPLFLKKILEEKNPRQQLKTASAQGLVLRSIVYKETNNAV